MLQLFLNCLTFVCLFVDSDVDISKKKLPDVTEVLTNETAKISDIEPESASDEIEILEKPERADIEKKLE